MSEKVIPTEIVVKATASLKEEVERDLKVEDPSEDKAKAVLNESTPRN